MIAPRSRLPIRQLLSTGILPSGVRRRLYRSRGYSIAGDVRLGPAAIIEADEVRIGAGAEIGPGTVIRGRSVEIGRRAQIGAMSFFEGRDLRIGDDTIIREQVFVGGPLFPDSLLSIGSRSRVFQDCYLNPSRPLLIGDDTGVGGRSSIFTHGSWQSAFEGYPASFEPVTIGDQVWLPWHVFILPGVEIGDRATIGAGSVVNRSVPPGVLAAGVPARVLREQESWPRPIDADQRWDLAKRVMHQLAEYMAANGLPARTETAPFGLALRLQAAGGGGFVALSRELAEAPAEADVAVGLAGSPVAGGPAAWFSILDRRRGGDRSELAEEVADFLGRYGVRFEVADGG